MEALILTLDVACVVYLCWRVFRWDPKQGSAADLGLLRYRSDDDQP